MEGPPGFLFVGEPEADFSGEGVGQMEGDELKPALLLPMGEAGEVFGHIEAGIHEWRRGCIHGGVVAMSDERMQEKKGDKETWAAGSRPSRGGRD